MLAAEFDFDLPPGLIAQHPVEPRDASRLLVIRRQTGCIEHRMFRDLPIILDSRDVLALNNTRVVPARLAGRRELTGGKWEGLFLQELEEGLWEVLSKTRGRLRPGESIIITPEFQLILCNKSRGGQWTVRPCSEQGRNRVSETLTLLERYGHTPLPPYIRGGKDTFHNRLRYQTVFAQQPGSIAAPTAGLHFTETTFQELASRGIAWANLTLHVGVGTFLPMKTTKIDDHIMHSEWAELSGPSVVELTTRRASGGRIIAVGTTAARTLETAAASGELTPFVGRTRLFIRPGHVFHGLDALITNFHLPRSTLLVLVSAFAGIELVRRAYQEAIQQGYRFFSYGDAMLIL